MNARPPRQRESPPAARRCKSGSARLYRPEKIYVEAAVRDARVTGNVLRRFRTTPVEVIESMERLVDSLRQESPSLAAGKRRLVLAAQRGRFLKPCPGGRGRLGLHNICCNYHVINLGANCHMECSYCFLQWYLDMPCVVVYANHLALLAELDEFLSERRGDFLRIGTGELADSLALDSLTEYCALLVEFFARQPNAVLELKTKSDFVDNLLGLDHGRRTVPAWSVNPRSVQEANEHKTASITARFRAARKCVEAGYQVAFHFDPMIHYPGWETAYRLLVEEIFDTVDPSSVAWLSMGGLRMTPPLKETIRRRFPRSLLPFGELLPGDDGKMRYFKPIRVEMYRKALSWIRAVAPRVPVYLCMEKPEVWFRVFGSTAPDERELQNIICARLAD